MRLDVLTTEPDEPGHLPECRRVTVGVSNARAAHMGEGRYVCADGCPVKRAADEDERIQFRMPPMPECSPITITREHTPTATRYPFPDEEAKDDGE